MTARTCALCGKQMASNSKHAYQCGTCVKRRAALAQAGRYQRVHVHLWPNGEKTIEDGVKCDGSEHGREVAA